MFWVAVAATVLLVEAAEQRQFRACYQKTLMGSSRAALTLLYREVSRTFDSSFTQNTVLQVQASVKLLLTYLVSSVAIIRCDVYQLVLLVKRLTCCSSVLLQSYHFEATQSRGVVYGGACPSHTKHHCRTAAIFLIHTSVRELLTSIAKKTHRSCVGTVLLTCVGMFQNLNK